MPQKNILLTGGAGYIGSHTVLNFLSHGLDSIIIFDNLENGSEEALKVLRDINVNLKFIKGDLRNMNDLKELFSDYSIDTVIHFAAFTSVGESVSNPSKYYHNNTVGTMNLLDAMLEHDCKKIVFSSTCSTYGEPQTIPVDENHSQNPINPYGSSKLMAEKIMRDYGEAYGLKFVIFRYFNVIGADEKGRIGESYEKKVNLIPVILRSCFRDGEVFKILGDDYPTVDGTCVRDYIDVEDLAEAHWLAYKYLDEGNDSDIFNLGTGKGYSVKQIFQSCEEVIARRIPVQVVGRRPGDPAQIFADASKAKELLNWEPKRSLKDSISSAYGWIRKCEEMKM